MRKIKNVQITYTFKIGYEHIEHLKRIISDLKKYPMNDMSGGGCASDDKVYGYSCKRIGNGSVANVKVRGRERPYANGQLPVDRRVMPIVTTKRG